MYNRITKSWPKLSLLLAAFLLGTPLASAMSNEPATEGGAAAPAKTLVVQKVDIVKYLLKKVKWPAGVIPQNSLNLCVIGQDETLGNLSAMDGTTLDNRQIKVRKITDIDAKAIKKDCQFLYVCSSEAKNTVYIINLFKKYPILLLADIENFAENGGTMNFSKIKDKIALTINMDSLASAQLKMELDEFDEITVIPSMKDVMAN